MSENVHESQEFGYIDVGNLTGVQTALVNLGLDPGQIDGSDGPKTQAALRTFQTSAGIGVDGIVGPATRTALLAALTAKLEEQARAGGAVEQSTT
jgi:peptidoglycan hydrolase-like protein with peptidoglycan-binding domain